MTKATYHIMMKNNRMVTGLGTKHLLLVSHHETQDSISLIFRDYRGLVKRVLFGEMWDEQRKG